MVGGGREKGKLPGPKPGPPRPTKEKPHDLAQPKREKGKAWPAEIEIQFH